MTEPGRILGTRNGQPVAVWRGGLLSVTDKDTTDEERQSLNHALEKTRPKGTELPVLLSSVVPKVALANEKEAIENTHSRVQTLRKSDRDVPTQPEAKAFWEWETWDNSNHHGILVEKDGRIATEVHIKATPANEKAGASHSITLDQSILDWENVSDVLLLLTSRRAPARGTLQNQKSCHHRTGGRQESGRGYT